MRAAAQQALAPGVIVLLALVNLVGPGLVERSEGLLNAGKLGILLAFVVVGLASPGLTLERLAPASWVSPGEIIGSGMLVFLSYEGFELIANASDRIRDPSRTLPLAYYGSILTAMILYVLMVVVAIGHLSFDTLAAARDLSLAAAAKPFLGNFGFTLMEVGAVLATASAINADLFGASKIPVILVGEGQMPKRYGREIWGRYPVGLIVMATLAVLIARYLDLHAISATASAGFLLIFAMVNVGNAKLARKTGSRRWISVLAAAGCFGALGVMVAQLAGQPQHAHAAWIIVGLGIFPFVYELIYRTIAARA
jgi:amino acid transporter